MKNFLWALKYSGIRPGNVVPTACHRPLGRRMLVSDKQPSASSLSGDFWLGRRSAAEPFCPWGWEACCQTQVPGLGGARRSQVVGSAPWRCAQMQDMSQPHCRRVGSLRGCLSGRRWPSLVSLPGKQREWGKIQGPVFCPGRQSFYTQFCMFVW